MKQRVLITGINGFIGRHVARVLAQAGHEVSGVSLEGEARGLPPGVAYQQLDLCDHEATAAHLTAHPVDVVVHLAALVHVRDAALSFDDYARVNYRASEALFLSAVATGASRLLFASTVEIYGPQLDGAVVTEATCPRPDSDYARAKLLAEQSLERVGKIRGIPVAALRFGPVYASNFRLNLDKRLYLKPPVLAYTLGRGNYRLSLCSLRNIETFIARFIDSPSPPSGAFNLVDHESPTARQLLALERRHGRARVIVPLPVTPSLLALALRELACSLRGLDAGMFSTANFRKLARSTVYSCARAEQTLGRLPGNVERDLYESEEP